MEESAQIHVPVTLPLGESPQYPLNMRLGGLHSQSGHFGIEKALASAGNRSIILQSSSLQEHATFIFMVKQSKKGTDCLILKMEVVRYSDVSVIIYQSTQYNFPEALNLYVIFSLFCML
jgi:hypothetical protein